MKELDEVLTDLAEHRHWLWTTWPYNVNLSVEEDDQMVNRFLKTFYPDEHGEYFK